MTTVAWDGNILASDSLVTTLHHGGYMSAKGAERSKFRFDQTTKISQFKNGTSSIFGETIVAMGGAGNLKSLKMVSAACREGMELDKLLLLPNLFPDNTTSTYLFITNKRIRVASIEGPTKPEYSEYSLDENIAIGSGKLAALLMMNRFGLSAPAAVAVASTVCDYTDRNVRYLTSPFTEPSKIYTYTDEDIEHIFDVDIKSSSRKRSSS